MGTTVSEGKTLVEALAAGNPAANATEWQPRKQWQQLAIQRARLLLEAEALPLSGQAAAEAAQDVIDAGKSTEVAMAAGKTVRD